ncbi:MAG: flagellar hook-length control protein FliK [Hyphomicrobiales bacterium]|nr:flagellar hook-length control protein FliK [Hyphomicrobiales bacterium]
MHLHSRQFLPATSRLCRGSPPRASSLILKPLNQHRFSAPREVARRLLPGCRIHLCREVAVSRVASEVSVMPSHAAAGGTRRPNTGGPADGAFESMLDDTPTTPRRREPSAPSAGNKPERKADPGPSERADHPAQANEADAGDPPPTQASDSQNDDADATANTDQAAVAGVQDPAKAVAETLGEALDADTQQGKEPADAQAADSSDPMTIADAALPDPSQLAVAQIPAVPIEPQAASAEPASLPTTDEIAAANTGPKAPPRAAGAVDAGDDTGAGSSADSGADLGADWGDEAASPAGDAAEAPQFGGKVPPLPASGAHSSHARSPAQGQAAQGEPQASEAVGSGERKQEGTPEDSVGTTDGAPKPPSPRPSSEPPRHAAKDKAPAQASELTAHNGAPEPLSAATNNTVTGNVSVAHTSIPAATAAEPQRLSSDQTAASITGLALEIAARAQSGSTRFEVRLDPPELGRVDVRLDVDQHGHVTSRLVVEKAETLDLLRREAPELERALQQAGLKTGDNGLQFTLRDQSFTGQQRDGDGRSARLVVTDPELAPVDTAAASYGRNLRLGEGVDIRI